MTDGFRRAHRRPFATRLIGDRVRLRKWYFAANLNALRHFFDLIMVTVESAVTRTGLSPVCLLEGRDDYGLVEDRLAWLAARGVKLVLHRASLFEIVEAQFGEPAKIFAGHWLRCDIPDIERDEECILYTDIDVIFRRDLACSVPRPRFVACTPEIEQDDFAYFNSGVMVMNVPAMRSRRSDVIDVLKRSLPGLKPCDDQGILNNTFQGQWDRLPNGWNWKPYWGVNDDACVVHFHALKPSYAEALMDGRIDQASAGLYQRFFASSPAGYARYVREFADVLETAKRSFAQGGPGLPTADGAQPEFWRA